MLTEGESWRRPSQLWGAIWVGIFLIGIGMLFWLDSMGVISFFPGILILIGILMVIGGIIGYYSR